MDSLRQKLSHLNRMAQSAQTEIERLRKCCDHDAPNWKPLAVQNASLVSLLLESDGKRGSLTLLTQEQPPLHIAIDHDVVFSQLDGVEQRFLSLDDSSVALLIVPAEGKRVVVKEACVDYWLENEDPSEMLTPPADGSSWDPKATFNLRLGFCEA